MKGMTRLEIAVMRDWDDGMGSKAIAQRCEVAEDRVTQILSRYCEKPDERRHPELMRQGSAQLLAAMHSAGLVPATGGPSL